MTFPAHSLIQRAATLTVGDLSIPAGSGTGLDIAFTVKRTLKAEPNTCDLKIHNLTRDHQKQLAQAKDGVACILAAGYVGAGQSVIFSGELRAGQTVTDGATRTTELSTGDGDKALRQARLSVALGPGSTGADGLKKIAAALGVGSGNLAKAVNLVQSNPALAQYFTKGAVIRGSAAEWMSQICASAGLEWSIQDGALQLLELGAPLSSQAILVDSDHGMVGAPTVDTKGILTVTTLMIPGVKPGVKLSMDAEDVQGGYRVISVESSGDSLGAEWYHRCEAVRY